MYFDGNEIKIDSVEKLGIYGVKIIEFPLLQSDDKNQNNNQNELKLNDDFSNNNLNSPQNNDNIILKNNQNTFESNEDHLYFSGNNFTNIENENSILIQYDENLTIPPPHSKQLSNSATIEIFLLFSFSIHQIPAIPNN